MNPLQAFPFRDMTTIVNLIADGEASISEIRSATGMCSFDSTEVSDMLAFLTSFGKVEAHENKWRIQIVEEEPAYERFRKVFLEDAVAILRQLSDTGKSVEQISKEAELSNEKVDLYLPFLAEITRLGVISRCSTGYPSIWCQKSE